MTIAKNLVMRRISLIVAVTRCMALDLAPDKIRVNAVCPGVTYTEHMQQRLEREMGLGREQVDEHPEWGGLHMLHGLPHARPTFHQCNSKCVP